MHYTPISKNKPVSFCYCCLCYMYVCYLEVLTEQATSLATLLPLNQLSPRCTRMEVPWFGILLFLTSQMHFSVGCHNKNTGIILCVFYRSDKDWKVMNASLPTMGRDFKELEPKIIEYLSKTNIVSQGNILEGANWNPASGKVFNLKKDETLSLPSLNKIIVGLGWDPATSGTIDIDSGCILVDDRDETDVVYFGNKESKDKSVRHGGDNLTGEGAGDDEQIHVNVRTILQCKLISYNS